MLENDFYWLASDFTARLAKVCRRGDTNESLAVTCYTSGGVKKHLLVHRVLGFTFKCIPDVWRQCAIWSQVSADCLTARSIGYEVHHVSHNHGCSLLANLRVLTVREHQRIMLMIEGRWLSVAANDTGCANVYNVLLFIS